MTTPTNVNTESVNAAIQGSSVANAYLIDPDTGQPYDSNHPLPTSGGITELAFLSAGSLNADLMQSTDVSTFKAFSLQVSGTWVGVLTVQGSNDNINFRTLTFYVVDGSNNGVQLSLSSNNLVAGPIPCRFMRVRMTSYTSGTANGVMELYATVPAQTLVSGLINTAQQGTWTVQPGNTANTTPWKVDGSGVVQPIGRVATTIYTTSQSGLNTTFDSPDQAVGTYDQLLLIINLTAFTGTSVTFKIRSKDAFGVYASIATTGAISTLTTTSLACGPTVPFGSTILIEANAISVTSMTFTLTLIGK